MWSRLVDAAFSLVEYRALEIHARIERWSLDEIALPGNLVHQIMEWLYRENRLCRGALKINETTIDPSQLLTPTLAIITTADDIAPRASLQPFIAGMPRRKHASLKRQQRLECTCGIWLFWSAETHERRFGRKSSLGSNPQIDQQPQRCHRT
jgi:hypothetical protein